MGGFVTSGTHGDELEFASVSQHEQDDAVHGEISVLSGDVEENALLEN